MSREILRFGALKDFLAIRCCGGFAFALHSAGLEVDSCMIR
jgi:hypothetical protein